MYDRTTIGLEEAMAGIQSMIKEASKEPDKPMTVCVVDERGELVAFARMDGATELFTEMAIKKAKTTVQFRRHTGDLMTRLESIQHRIYWFGPDFTVVPSGLAITKPGEYKASYGKLYGAIGTSGRIAGEKVDDLAIAEVGLKAIQDYVWPSG